MSDQSIRVSSYEVNTSMFYLAIANKVLRHCQSWLARQYTLMIVCLEVLL